MFGAWRLRNEDSVPLLGIPPDGGYDMASFLRANRPDYSSILLRSLVFSFLSLCCLLLPKTGNVWSRLRWARLLSGH